MINVEIAINEVEIAPFAHQLTNFLKFKFSKFEKFER